MAYGIGSRKSRETYPQSPGAGGFGGGGGGLFVFRPGGTPGGNVYVTEAALSAAMAGTTGATLVFDMVELGSDTQYTFTTVGELDLGESTDWVLTNTADVEENECALNFVNGTTLAAPPASIRGAVLEAGIISSQDTPVITTEGGDWVLVLDHVGVSVDGSGSFWESDTGDVEVYLRGGASISSQVSGAFVFDLSHNILVVEDGEVNEGAAPTTSATAISAGPMAVVDPSFYPHLTVDGLYVDTSGAGIGSFPILPVGALLSTNSTLYISNGTEWTGV